MKQLISFLFFTILLSNVSFAQIGNIVQAADPVPESASNTGISTYDPGFTDSFVLTLSHGLTTFKQTHEIMLVDAKTFAIKKKIEFPSYDGYSFDMGNKRILPLKGNFVLLYKGKAKKGYTIDAVKINEALAIPGKPQYLFTVEGDLREWSRLEYTKNEKKDMCLFSYYVNDKKTKSAVYHYRVYDNDLNLLKNDSIVSDIKNADTLNSLIYEKGVIVTKNQGNGRVISIVDVKANKTYTLQPTCTSNYMVIENAKSIANDKVVLFGRYFTWTRKERHKGGAFKIVYNTKTNNIESQIYIDKVPTASKDEEFFCEFKKSIITDAGACYALVSQAIGGELDMITKYEMVYINTETDKWKKQVPLSSVGSIDMVISDRDIVISYYEHKGDNTIINYDNYAFVQSLKGRSSEYNAALMKINTKTSDVQQQSFPGFSYQYIMSYNNEFIGITQGINGIFYGKCVLFKINLGK